MTSKINLPQVEMIYESLNKNDKVIANFFFNEAQLFSDLSAKKVADHLHISIPTLTRFAQKCGYKGYRQLIYDVEYSKDDLDKNNVGSSNVLGDYSILLKKAAELNHDDTLKNICDDISTYDTIYIYGIGHSGLAAKEIELRFNRIGLKCRAITDREQILVNAAIVDTESLVIGLSISGKNEATIKGLKNASLKGGKTYLLTTQKYNYEGVDETIFVPSVINLNYGNRISPQYPLLIIVDLIYDRLMQNNSETKGKIFFETLVSILDEEQDENTDSI